ncbi:hypothetical protein PENTCL1PPCAC_1353, partial [Pristionchus entomophagus]
KEFEGPATPRAEEAREVAVPPAPDTAVDPEVQEKFRKMFENKARGQNINQFIQTRKDFKNPSIYELFIESHEIKEFGSNFPLEQYNPDGFTQECYYDYIAARKAAAGDAPAVKKPKMSVLRQVRQQCCVGALRASSSSTEKVSARSSKGAKPVTRAQLDAACAPRVFKYTDSLVRHLEQSLILHEPGRFVILQKPYGVPCLGFKQKDGGVFKNSVHNSLDRDEVAEERYESLERTVTIADCIPQLSKMLREPQLGFCTGLKRYLSGPLILPCGKPDFEKMRASLRTAGSLGAAGEEDAEFYQHSALAIVIGQPEKDEGTVDGFATFQPVGDHKEYVFEEGVRATRRQKTGKYAVQGGISWNTIASDHDCSLLHLQFGKFARHLPRLALSHLDCPILGDSIYAQRFFDVDGKPVRMEPARAARNKGKKYTPPRLVARLGKEAPPLADLPMYFHVWQTVLPKYGGDSDLVASAPPPPHFEAMVDLLGFGKELKEFWSETESNSVLD